MVFGDFCLEQSIDFITLSQTGYLFLANVLNRVWFWVKCLKQGIKNRTICLKQGQGGIKNRTICLKQGQGFRGRAAPPHSRIYRVRIPPGTLTFAIYGMLYFFSFLSSILFFFLPDRPTHFYERESDGKRNIFFGRAFKVIRIMKACFIGNIPLN